MPTYDIQALALGTVWASLFSPPDTFREREHEAHAWDSGTLGYRKKEGDGVAVQRWRLLFL